jgi:3-oxoacyl-[acyl-carrier-protein] synthase II
MAQFAQYAMAATEEALQDADWKPESFEQREATVCVQWMSNILVECILIGYSRVSVWDQALEILTRSTTQL